MREPVDSTTGAEAAVKPKARSTRRSRWIRGAVLALIVTGVVIATIANESRVSNVDPTYVRVMVERTHAYGGTFYDNLIYNKGPLEPLLHQIASLVTSYDTYWLGIAAIQGLLTLVIALAAARTTRFSGATVLGALAVGTVAFIHFAFSKSDYAGAVYVRYLMVALLAVGWVVLISERAWLTEKRRLIATAAVSVTVAVAVQTLLTTALAAMVLLAATHLLLRERAPSGEQIKLVGVSLICLPLAFLTAPIWYWARGAFDAFWAGWWVHAGFSASGLERTFGEQLTLGWKQLRTHHLENPLVLVVVVLFGILVAVRWRSWNRRQRIVHGTAIAWWVAGWAELVVSQRYSTHYFSVVAVPVVIMAALLIGAAAAASSSRAPRVAAAATVVALAVAGHLVAPGAVWSALKEVRDFRGVSTVAEQRAARLGPQNRTMRAILDLVSAEGDPLLAWQHDPTQFMLMERVSATRFGYVRPLVGEIYLGATSPDYVLPQTWPWFFEDINESDPTTLIEVGSAIPSETPFASYAGDNFTPVYMREKVIVSFRNDVARDFIGPSAHTRWEPQPSRPGSGWSMEGEVLVYTPASEPAQTDLHPIASSCSRIEGTVSWTAGRSQGISIYFHDATGGSEPLHFTILRTEVFSASERSLYETHTLIDDGPKGFAIVVGRQSAALIMEGRVVAAVRLSPSVTVTIQPRADRVELSDMRIGSPPEGGGCP